MSLNDWSTKKIFLIIVILCLTTRIIAIWAVGDRQLEYEFGILVPNLLKGHGYSFYSVDQQGNISPQIIEHPQEVIPSAYMPPVYPFFLAGICYVLGISKQSIILIELIQAVIASITCILLYKIVDMKFNKNVAILSGLIFACYPILVFASSQISAVSIYLFLNMLFVYFLFRGEEDWLWKNFLYAGIAFGLLVLSRGQVILYLPFILAWIYLVGRGRSLTSLAVFALAAVMVIGPWAVRNCVRFGRVAPLVVSGGLNLWQGQNEKATGTRSQYTDLPVSVPKEIEDKIRALSPGRDYELKRDKILFDEAKAFMLNNPSKVAKLAAKKFVFYWGHYWGINFTYPGAKSPLYWLPWFMLLPFFIIGLVSSFKDYNKYSLFYIYFVLSTGIVMIFFVLPRYRLFILPFVIPFAVSGIYIVKNRLGLAK